jgi:hypothetical protein
MWKYISSQADGRVTCDYFENKILKEEINDG